MNDDMLRCMIRAEHRKMVQNSMLFRNENAKSDAEMHRFRAKTIRKLHILEPFSILFQDYCPRQSVRESPGRTWNVRKASNPSSIPDKASDVADKNVSEWQLTKCNDS